MSDCCKHEHTDRTGLYIMVFIILMCVIGESGERSQINAMDAKIDNIIETLEVCR